ncbi:MAG: hypothetical protein NC177_13535 [Ruminococcus flavefaciens]|nr:hypothetical protein [Ruminococcus flavefaciens]
MFGTRVDIVSVENGYASFELVDCHGVCHFFREKLSSVKLYYYDSGSLTGDGTIRCKIIKSKENTYVIDTSEPDNIKSVDGLHEFEVKKSGTGRLLKWQYNNSKSD